MNTEKITEELQRIQGTIPACYLKNVLNKEKMFPTVKRVVEQAVQSKDISEEKKEEYKLLLESGDLDREELIENPIIVNKINKWVDKKINEAIKAKRLPSYKELKKYYENKKRTS